MGYRIIANRARGPKPILVLQIKQRPTVAKPAEMRIWRRAEPVLPARKMAKDFPGVAETATMKLEYVNEKLGVILEAMGKQWGFLIEDSDIMRQQVMLVVPGQVTAWQAVNMVNDLLSADGQVLDLTPSPEGKFILKVVQLKDQAKPEIPELPFKFENAPLEVVLAELSKQSGYPVRNTVPEGIKVSINEVLKGEPIGVDVGPTVARLNEILEKQGTVILETSRGGADGKLEPLLRVMPLAEAKKTLLGPALESMPPAAPEKEWVHVDMDNTMTFQFTNAPTQTILGEMARRFGFVVLADVNLNGAISVTSPQPQNAAGSVKLINDILHVFGYCAVVIPNPESGITELRVVTLGDLKTFVWTGRFKLPAK